MGRPLGFAPKAALEDLGLPMKARCGAGAAACLAGVLAAPGPQRSWQLGQQEVWCSRRVWQPVLTNTLVFLPGEPPWHRSLAGHSLQDHKALHTTKAARCIHTSLFVFFFLFLPVSSAPGRVEHAGGAAAWPARALAAPSVQGHRLPLRQELWLYQSLCLSLL